MSKGRFKRTKLRLRASELQREIEEADAALMEAVVAG